MDLQQVKEQSALQQTNEDQKLLEILHEADALESDILLERDPKPTPSPTEGAAGADKSVVGGEELPIFERAKGKMQPMEDNVLRSYLDSTMAITTAHRDIWVAMLEQLDPVGHIAPAGALAADFEATLDLEISADIHQKLEDLLLDEELTAKQEWYKHRTNGKAVSNAGWNSVVVGVERGLVGPANDLGLCFTVQKVLGTHCDEVVAAEGICKFGEVNCSDIGPAVMCASTVLKDQRLASSLVGNPAKVFHEPCSSADQALMNTFVQSTNRHFRAYL